MAKEKAEAKPAAKPDAKATARATVPQWSDPKVAESLGVKAFAEGFSFKAMEEASGTFSFTDGSYSFPLVDGTGTVRARVALEVASMTDAQVVYFMGLGLARFVSDATGALKKKDLFTDAQAKATADFKAMLKLQYSTRAAGVSDPYFIRARQLAQEDANFAKVRAEMKVPADKVLGPKEKLALVDSYLRTTDKGKAVVAFAEKQVKAEKEQVGSLF